MRFDREIESKIGKQVMGMVILLDAKGKVVNPNPAFGFSRTRMPSGRGCKSICPCARGYPSRWFRAGNNTSNGLFCVGFAVFTLRAGKPNVFLIAIDALAPTLLF